jgi:uncharacterized protein (DUF427 family)
MKKITKIEPQAGQESVWDYPRPPLIEDTDKHLQVFLAGSLIAETRRAKRVVEKSHPPVYYFPIEDIQMEYLDLNTEVSFCEYKGRANYYNLLKDDKALSDIAWTYLKPPPGFESISGMVAFYPNRGLECFVNGERVQPQAGEFYGGWITNDIIGPFKGESGTWGW